MAVLSIPAFILGFIWAPISGGVAAGRLTFFALLVAGGVADAKAVKFKEVDPDE